MQVKFAEDLATDVKVWVAPDPESKTAIEAAESACGSGTTGRRVIQLAIPLPLAV